MARTQTDLVIGPAQPRDIPDIAALWTEAFPGTRSAAERARLLETGGRYGGLETTLVAHRPAGPLVGACKIYPMTQYIGGVAMRMMGLAAVAVDPSARREGIGARLCVRAMEAARARGDVISTLYPFRADYYRRLGWGLVGELHEYGFLTSALPRYPDSRHVRPARGAADARDIAACYDRAVARSTGPIERDPTVWGYRLYGEEFATGPLAASGVPASVPEPSGQGSFAVVFDRGGVCGYALLHGSASSEPRESRLRIRELVAETEEAYRGLLGYIAGRSDRWPVGRYAARPEERFGDRLPDPRRHGAPPRRSLHFSTAQILRGPMLRILDVPRALGLRRYFGASPAASRRSADLDISVADPQVKANTGTWRVRIRGGDATVEPLAGPRGDPEYEAAGVRLEVDASTLARIFTGEWPVGRAATLGAARVTGDPDLADAAFATRERFWLLDEF
jgi:predicted N-acetyltransferase YhbS